MYNYTRSFCIKYSDLFVSFPPSLLFKNVRNKEYPRQPYMHSQRDAIDLHPYFGGFLSYHLPHPYPTRSQTSCIQTSLYFLDTTFPTGHPYPTRLIPYKESTWRSLARGNGVVVVVFTGRQQDLFFGGRTLRIFTISIKSRRLTHHKTHKTHSVVRRKYDVGEKTRERRAEDNGSGTDNNEERERGEKPGVK